MVKSLNITLDDEDLERLKRKRRELGMTWREFILLLLEYKEGGKHAGGEGEAKK